MVWYNENWQEVYIRKEDNMKKALCYICGKEATGKILYYDWYYKANINSKNICDRCYKSEISIFKKKQEKYPDEVLPM